MTRSGQRPPLQIGENALLTDREHMLQRPEMYINSVGTEAKPHPVLARGGELGWSADPVNRGVLHLLLEIYSNAADNATKHGRVAALARELERKGAHRDRLCAASDALVQLTLSPRNMEVLNYGAPFKIAYMPDLPGVLIPEACFTCARVGSNFHDDARPRIGVGRNGIGAKLVAYYSKELYVECANTEDGRYFRMRLLNNGDPATRSVETWPPLSVGAPDPPRADPNAPGTPDWVRAAAARGRSFTLVRWVPDTEEGPLSPDALGAFLGSLPPSAQLVVRATINGQSETHQMRLHSPESGLVEVRVSARQTSYVDLRRETNVRRITAPECGVACPPRQLIFHGSDGVSDSEIEACSRVAADFAVCGLPCLLRREWRDGTREELLVTPLTPADYGKRLYGAAGRPLIIQLEKETAGVGCIAVLFDTPGAGKQGGFVNGLWTPDGIHVRAAYTALMAALRKDPHFIKYGGHAGVADLRKHVSCIVHCVGPNPQQEGQTKESLTTIGGLRTLSFPAIDGVGWICTGAHHWGAIDELTAAQEKEERDGLRKKMQGKKTHGYIPANNTGPGATLILTEGDSCVPYAAIMRNLGDDGNIGILPMRGVPANLYEAGPARVLANALFGGIMRVTGLDPERSYATAEERQTLKYGAIVFMGDPDLDGFHIVALMVANLYYYWPFLFHERRVGALRTPVVRLYHGSSIVARYYSDKEYSDAVASGTAPRGTPKRIKGLGSVDSGTLQKPAPELRDDFAHANVMWFSVDDASRAAMHDFFAKDRAGARKGHISVLAPNCSDLRGCIAPDSSCSIPPVTQAPVLCRPYHTYIAKELIQYSVGSLRRAIPGLYDGLKDAQRKILAWFIEHSSPGNNPERKVDQLAGSVANEQHYHHGAQCLGATIKRMALGGFPGANNLPVITAKSNVGSKHNFPKDAAADRYAFVKLSPWIFHAIHKDVYGAVPRAQSDGEDVEPDHIPCDIPIALINGVVGVATGWQTYLPPCHPASVLNFMTELARADVECRCPQLPEIPFWYEGFQGTIETKNNVSARAIPESAALPEDFADGTLPANDGPSADTLPEFPAETLEPPGEASPPPYIGQPELMETYAPAARAICCRGNYRLLGPAPHYPNGAVHITEVPPERRLNTLNEAIDDLISEKLVKNYTHTTKNGINYVVGLTAQGAQEIKTVLRALRLEDTYALTNFNLLQPNGAPYNVGTAQNYALLFYEQAIRDYDAGRLATIAARQERAKALLARQRYVYACVTGRIRPGQTTAAELEKILVAENIPEELTNLKARDISVEGVERLAAEIAALHAEIAALQAKRPCELYLANLLELARHMPLTPPPRQVSPGVWAPQ